MKHKTSKSLKFGEIKIAIEIEIEIYPFFAKIAEKIKIAFFFFWHIFFGGNLHHWLHWLLLLHAVGWGLHSRYRVRTWPHVPHHHDQMIRT